MTTRSARVMSTNPADWYRRAYPLAPALDERCLRVLSEWQALYNIHPARDHRKDGGFHKCGDGVLITGHWRLSTWDDASLTSLMLAAHRHQCRVEIRPVSVEYLDDALDDTKYDPEDEDRPPVPAISIFVTPRDPHSAITYDWHPDLTELAHRIKVMTDAE